MKGGLAQEKCPWHVDLYLNWYSLENTSQSVLAVESLLFLTSFVATEGATIEKERMSGCRVA